MTKTVRLIHSFGKQIAQGTFAPGAALPSEAELCLRFEASRNVMREVIKVLSTKRLIDAQPHRVGPIGGPWCGIGDRPGPVGDRHDECQRKDTPGMADRRLQGRRGAGGDTHDGGLVDAQLFQMHSAGILLVHQMPHDQ